MKVIDAVWEKRNLGISTSEIIVENTDSYDDIYECLSIQSSEYLVLKVPTSQVGLVWEIQKNGFVYVEDMVHLVSNLKVPPRSPIESRVDNAVTYRIMNKSDLEDLIRKIKNGLFKTDRISIDPSFTKEQASERYVNWVKDEWLSGTSFYSHIYKGKKIGFVSVKEKYAGRYISSLGGMYPEYQNAAYGSVVKVIDIVKMLGGRSVETDVSTNNPAQIRNLINYGYMPTGISHTFVKHS